MTGTRSHWIIAGLALLLQLGFQAWFFPLSEVFSATPLLRTDNAFHLYRIEVFRAFCGSGQLLGYDPFFAAGQLRGLSYSSSAKLQTLLACVMDGPHGAVVAYKLSSVVLSLVAVLAVPASAALLRLSTPASALATLFGLIMWWATPMRWYHTVGMASFVAAAYLALPYALALQRLAASKQRRLWPWALAAVVGGLLSVLHALFVVCVALLLVGLAAAHLSKPQVLWRGVLALALLGLATLLFNAPWFFDAWRLPGPWLRSDQPFQRIVDPLLPFKEALQLAPTIGGGSRFYAVLLLGCLALLLVERWQRTSPRADTAPVWPLGLAGAILLSFAALGAANPGLGNLVQPNRFVLPGWLCLVIPAAAGSVGLARWLWAGWREQRTSLQQPQLRPPGGTAKLAAAASLLLPVLLGSFFYVRELALEVHGAPGPRHGVSRPEVKPVGALSSELVAALKPTGPGDDGRVLFELSYGGVYEGAHIAGLYARWSQREFIGGPYPYFHSVSLEEGTWLGQPLRGFSAEALAASLDLYNITLIVCHTPICHDKLGTLPAVKRQSAWGRVALYRRAVASSYVLAGSGQVTARAINRLEVHSQGSGELVLKYHWVPGLQSDPPQTIEARRIGNAPQAFVVLPAPPPRFTLSARP